jgi:hypothetical protein
MIKIKIKYDLNLIILTLYELNYNYSKFFKHNFILILYYI